MKPHRGVLILILGILSFVLCGIFSAIPAWVMGSGDLKQMDAGTMDPAGRGMTQAGKILGMIAVILTILGVVVFVALMALGILAGAGGQR
jgi:hypothetical protein